MRQKAYLVVKGIRQTYLLLQSSELSLFYVIFRSLHDARP